MADDRARMGGTEQKSRPDGPMRQDDYAEIKDAVEGAGFFTTFQPIDDDVLWIVLVSHCTDGRLHGNSFRLSVRSGRWYLITWSPVYYRVPPDADLARLCLA